MVVVFNRETGEVFKKKPPMCDCRKVGATVYER
jgi:hypothetical protein